MQHIQHILHKKTKHRHRQHPSFVVVSPPVSPLASHKQKKRKLCTCDLGAKYITAFSTYIPWWLRGSSPERPWTSSAKFGQSRPLPPARTRTPPQTARGSGPFHLERRCSGGCCGVGKRAAGLVHTYFGPPDTLSTSQQRNTRAHPNDLVLACCTHHF